VMTWKAERGRMDSCRLGLPFPRADIWQGGPVAFDQTAVDSEECPFSGTHTSLSRQ